MAWNGRIFGLSINPIDYIANAAHKVSGGNIGYDADLYQGLSVQGGDRNPVRPIVGDIGIQMPSSNRTNSTNSNSKNNNNNNNNSNALGSATGAFAGGVVAPALPELNMAAIRNTQRAIDEIPGLLNAALAAEKTRYDNTIRAFNDQERAQRRTYDQSTTTNQQNYDANYMDSIRAGISGLSGLMNILRGTGAAGGTAEDMVRDTVGDVTSSDIRAGADTRDANQIELDTALSNFLTELKGKRQAADDTYENNKRAIHRDSQTQLQDLYGKMAGYYSDAQRTAEAQSWMKKAGDLTPKIAANSRTQQSRYDTTPVQVAAPQLTAFAAPSQPDVVVAPQNGQVGSGIFTMSRRPQQEDREENRVPVGV